MSSFGISKWKMFDRQNKGMKNMVEVDKDRGLLGKFLRERNQSQIKDQLVQRKHLKIDKVFLV